MSGAAVIGAVHHRHVGRRAWFWVAVVGTFVVRLHLATSVGGPILSDDGAGYLGNARWLAGTSTPDFTFGKAYGLGYSMLLAPFSAVGMGPDSVVLAARILNAAMASAIAVPIAALVRDVWPILATRADAIGLAVSLSPALLLQPAFVWPETLLPLLFATWCLASIRWTGGAGGSALAAMVALAAAAALVHDRALPLVLVTIGASLFAPVDGDVPRGHRLLGAAGSLLCAAAGWILTTAATDAMWPGTEPTSADRGVSIMSRVAPDGWLELLRSLAGQTWYIAAASLGVALVGGWVLVRAATTPDPERGTRQAAWVTILVATVGLSALSVVFMSDRPRVDHLLYGRYNEMWVPVVVAVGLGWMAASRRSVRVTTVACAAIPVLGAATFVVVGSERLAGSVMPLNVLGIVGPQVVVSGRGTWITAVDVVPVALIASAGLLVLIGAGRLRIAHWAGAAVWIALALVAHHGSLTGFRQFWSTRTTAMADAVASHDSGGAVAVELTEGSAQTRNMLAFWLGDDAVVQIAPGEWSRQPTGSLVVGPLAPPDDCLTMLASDTPSRTALWQISEDCHDG